MTGTQEEEEMSMELRVFATSACALGAAILATSVLQSRPAEAARHGAKAGHMRAHIVARKSTRIASLGAQSHARFHSGPPPGSHAKASTQGGDHVEPNVPTGDKGAGTNTGSGTGGGKTPPISATPTSNPNLPGNTGGGGGKVPPISATPSPNPNLPGTTGGGGNKPPWANPTPSPNPNLPGTTGGGNQPPWANPTPSPNPNLPTAGTYGGGTKTGGGSGTSTTYVYRQSGVYVGLGGDGGGYDPCWWFKRKYDNTGNVYWLNRYRHCLWRHDID
jgi:hypothetical protein